MIHAITNRFAVVFFLTASFAWADKPKVLEEFRGKVTGVIDGDTLTLHTTGKPLNIRLEGIDAPEAGQKFSVESRDALKKLVAGKEITVRKTGVDQSKRVMGTVIIDQTDVCKKMVEDGWAWHFKQDNTDEELAALETAARDAKRGVWQEAHPTSPWGYRAKRESSTFSWDLSSKPTPPVVVPPDSPPPGAAPESSNSGKIWVDGYTRKDGTKVKGYWRKK